MSTASVRYIVDDVDAAIDFYCRELGFEQQMHPDPAFAMLTRGDLRLVLVSPVGPDHPGGGFARCQTEPRSSPEGGTESCFRYRTCRAQSTHSAPQGFSSATTSSPASAANDPGPGPGGKPGGAVPAGALRSAAQQTKRPERHAAPLLRPPTLLTRASSRPAPGPVLFATAQAHIEHIRPDLPSQIARTVPGTGAPANRPGHDPAEPGSASQTDGSCKRPTHHDASGGARCDQHPSSHDVDRDAPSKTTSETDKTSRATYLSRRTRPTRGAARSEAIASLPQPRTSISVCHYRTRQRECCSRSGNTRSSSWVLTAQSRRKRLSARDCPAGDKAGPISRQQRCPRDRRNKRRCVPAPRTDPRPVAAPTCLCGARCRANRTALLVSDHSGTEPSRHPVTRFG